MDTFTATTDNSIFNGLVDYTAGGTATSATTTFQTVDTLTGSGGTGDTLNITVTGAATGPNGAVTLPAATVSGIEVINARSVTGSGQVVTLAGANFKGHTQLNSDRSTDAVTFTGVGDAAAVGIIGNGTVTNGNVLATYANATATTPTLNLSNGTLAGTVGITAAGATSMVINSTGAANSVGAITAPASATSMTINATTGMTTAGITAAGATKLTVAGIASTGITGSAAAVEVGTASAALTTIDASGLTAGGLGATLIAGITSLKGGQGNDSITTTALTTTTAGAIDAGAGTADRLNVASSTDVNSAAKGALYANFEVLRNSTTANQDVSLVSGITSEQLNGNGAGLLKMTAAQATSITNLINNAGATLALTDATGTADVLKVSLKNATATTKADLTTVIVDGFETMNVTSDSGASSSINTLSFTSANKLTALTLSGAFPISVDTGGLTTKAVAIDASGITFAPAAGSFALTLTNNLLKASSVLGTNAADSITTTAAAAGGASDFVTYNAGGGNDTFSSTVSAINNNGGGTASLKLDGGTGTDTLTLTGGGATLVDANFQYLTNIEEITTATAGVVSITTGGFFDANFKANGVTLTTDNSGGAAAITENLGTFTGNVTSVVKNATGSATSVTTGSGTDTITFTNAGTATTDTFTASTGAGADTINVNSKATGASNVIDVTAGQGADTIALATTARGTQAAFNEARLNVAAGDSTVAAFDTVSGVYLAAGAGKLSDNLNFDNSTLTAYATAAVTGFSAADLSYTVGAAGALTFTGNLASSLTDTQKATYAQAMITTNQGDSAYWTSGSDTYVFNNDTNGDSLLKLTGVTVAGLTTAAGTTTANYLYIG